MIYDTHIEKTRSRLNLNNKKPCYRLTIVRDLNNIDLFFEPFGT